MMARRKGRWVTERFRLVKKIILSGKKLVDWFMKLLWFSQAKIGCTSNTIRLGMSLIHS